MSRIYISGPITGVQNYKEIFLKKQLELEKLGNEVVNPSLLHLIMPKSSTWQEYMDICIPLLKLCGAVRSVACSIWWEHNKRWVDNYY